MFNPAIKYYCDPDTFDLFITHQVKELVECLYKELGERVTIAVYPDTAYENWGIPPGLAFISVRSDTFLFPTFLRDPGCGFLVFKVEFIDRVEDGWHNTAGEALDTLIRRNTNKPLSANPFLSENIDLKNILSSGLVAINQSSPPQNINLFQHVQFDVDLNHTSLTGRESRSLKNNFCTVSNTIELKKVLSVNNPQILSSWALSQDDIIGFVHTGCANFENILERRFAYKLAEYCIINELFTLEAIERGIYGVPLETDWGYQYYQWLKMAMNYALMNRYFVFTAIKKILEDRFPCIVSILKDSIHCGVIEEDSDRRRMAIFRGVQSIYDGETRIPNRSLTLLAGQKETISALVTGTKRTKDYYNLVSHGTSWNIFSDTAVYANMFNKQEQEKYLSLANNTFYNTKPDLKLCLPYTYNLLSHVEYLSRIGLLEQVCILSPFVNIQGEKHIQR